MTRWSPPANTHLTRPTPLLQPRVRPRASPAGPGRRIVIQKLAWPICDVNRVDAVACHHDELWREDAITLLADRRSCRGYPASALRTIAASPRPLDPSLSMSGL